MVVTEKTWHDVLSEEFEAQYYKDMWMFLDEAYATRTVFPPKAFVFEAFNLTPYNKVRVVILGQDPYHGVGQAHGLSFSVPKGVKLPPSLKNIFKELTEDIGCPMPTNGCLTEWAKQGVLMLNAFLTVEEKKPSSHSKIGWETFTDHVIQKLNDKEEPIVFVLWGNFAIQKKALITNSNHVVLTSPHPSPFSARKGFFESKPFSTINQYLEEFYKKPIDWALTIEREHEQLIIKMD